MKKIEQSILEVHRRIPVVRTIAADGVQNDFVKSLPVLQKKLSVSCTRHHHRNYRLYPKHLLYSQ